MELDISSIIAALGLLGATIASYVRLNARITKLETDLLNYKKAVEKLELYSEQHHEDLLKQVELLRESIFTVKELIITSNSKFDILQSSITSLHKVADTQDQRILNLEQMQYANSHTKPFKSRGPKRN